MPSSGARSSDWAAWGSMTTSSSAAATPCWPPRSCPGSGPSWASSCRSARSSSSPPSPPWRTPSTGSGRNRARPCRTPAHRASSSANYEHGGVPVAPRDAERDHLGRRRPPAVPGTRGGADCRAGCRARSAQVAAHRPGGPAGRWPRVDPACPALRTSRALPRAAAGVGARRTGTRQRVPHPPRRDAHRWTRPTSMRSSGRSARSSGVTRRCERPFRAEVACHRSRSDRCRTRSFVSSIRSSSLSRTVLRRSSGRREPSSIARSTSRSGRSCASRSFVARRPTTRCSSRCTTSRVMHGRSDCFVASSPACTRPSPQGVRRRCRN